MNKQLVSMVYDDAGNLLRIIVSDDYPTQEALEAVHVKGLERIAHFDQPVDRIATVDDLISFLETKTGKAVLEKLPNVDPKTPVLSPADQVLADSRVELFTAIESRDQKTIDAAQIKFDTARAATADQAATEDQAATADTKP